jgi:phosphatidylethanolamine/phosphatidyl-N-methylethanolamine N-methyltransferase
VFSFIREWTSAPGRVGAVWPSGAQLASVMTREISPASAPIIELGPGTGVFTRALLARGVREADLLLIDSGAEFTKLLEARFPAARVMAMDATRLGEQPLFDGAPVGAVVSGIPLLNLSVAQIAAIMKGAFGYLRPDGAFYQFTYGPRCPVPQPVLDQLGLEATRIGKTFFNVPPASVYRITRSPQADRSSGHRSSP